PFTMTSQSQFRTIAPPALTSAEYAADYNEVKELGWKFSTVRTAQQTAMTMFWVDMPGTITTVGRWNVIAQNVAIANSNTMWQNAQLFAKLNLALADAAIVAWDYKYHYELWRPVTAIRAGDTDGNPATIEDPNWEPLVNTPAFPEYVSAHSCFSATAAQILECFFRRDNVNFKIASYMMPMTYRTYYSFSQAVEEAGMSRIYGGIHFSYADSAGRLSGRALAKYVWYNYLLPLNTQLDTDGIDTDGDGDPDNDNVELRMAAGDGFTNMADGKLQYMFGFSNATGIPDNMVMMDQMLGATFSAPTIVVREGQKLYLALTNVGMIHRPDLFDPHTIHWHGFPNAASIFDGVPDASISINMGGTLTYFYNVVEPGTFMWHCHVEATEHMQMGMLGQLYVLPIQDNAANGTELNGFTHQTGYKYVYNDGDGSTYYDVDYPVQIASFDPAFHDASFDVQPLPFANMDDKYPMLNGRGYPDTVDPNVLWSTASDEGYMNRPSRPLNALITATVGEKVALRISSLSTTSFHTLTIPGIPMRVIGTGARLLRGPDGRDTGYLTNSVTLGGGQAVDVILDTDDIEPGTYVMYASELNHLSNNAEDYGGMMTEIRITAP
ncbi:MAG: phosphatase PAP2 family protein, partial [Phycisphaerae bacterium]|nr:phosphatase PAP2 family protein [Phycisphaerae bacterium]